MILVLPIKMTKELNMVTSKNQDWWLNSGATIHICHDKNMFKTYSEAKNLEKVLTENHVTAKVVGNEHLKSTLHLSKS